jgi:hypothetical protein
MILEPTGRETGRVCYEELRRWRKANLYMEKIRALLQISVDKKYISIDQYEHISGEINEAGKMIGGWIKSCGE